MIQIHPSPGAQDGGGPSLRRASQRRCLREQIQSSPNVPQNSRHHTEPRRARLQRGQGHLPLLYLGLLRIEDIQRFEGRVLPERLLALLPPRGDTSYTIPHTPYTIPHTPYTIQYTYTLYTIHHTPYITHHTHHTKHT
jgi:hypothetical protein